MNPVQSESEKSEESNNEHQTIPPQDYSNLISVLPGREGWAKPLRLFHNFWIRDDVIPKIMNIQQHFKPRPDDIFLLTHPKTGTTWLKALAYSIVNRFRYTFSEHPLLAHHPQECVQYLEIDLYRANFLADLEKLPSPRLLSSHMPLSMLPASISNLGCRFVYLCREPKDVFVSRWHFEKEMSENVVDMNQAFELFCEVVCPFGPIWDHYLEYWNESLARPKSVLFLKYEDLKRDQVPCVKRLATFLGVPFTEEEERDGAVEEVVRLCSFEKLKGLEVNKTGGVTLPGGALHEYSMFFRSGKVGDWANHLNSEMAAKLDRIFEEKFHGSGLTF